MKDEEERDNKRDISVIIPVYNVEKYIDQCLDSLQAQSFDNFEVICVDDGSLDHTVDRIREHMKTDPRIRLIEMPHCGLAGVMRNEGIKRAEGKYCLFLDGDDFFERDMLKKTFEKAEEDQADICLFDARLYNERTKVYKEIDYIIQKDYLPESIPFKGRSFPYILNITTGCPWNKLIRKSLIDEYQLQFMPLHRSNDVYFIFMALALAEKITVVQEVFVNYRQSGSSLQANNVKSCEKIGKFWREANRAWGLSQVSLMGGSPFCGRGQENAGDCVAKVKEHDASCSFYCMLCDCPLDLRLPVNQFLSYRPPILARSRRLCQPP